MNFTREPIIETILSPKDGYKLCIKNSKIPGSEELFVDVVEIVSFGHAFFFRGQERPKPFLVPVSDYEVFEVKETRVVLKNVSHDRSIKIGGGREAFAKTAKEQPAPREEEDDEEQVVSTATEVPAETKSDKKRDRRRNRRRRLAEERRNGPSPKEKSDGDAEESSSEEVLESEGPIEEVKVSSSMFAHLLPPPPTLISEKLNKMKEKERELAEAAANLAETVAEVAPDAVFPEEDAGEDSFPI